MTDTEKVTLCRDILQDFWECYNDEGPGTLTAVLSCIETVLKFNREGKMMDCISREAAIKAIKGHGHAAISAGRISLDAVDDIVDTVRHIEMLPGITKADLEAEDWGRRADNGTSELD